MAFARLHVPFAYAAVRPVRMPAGSGPGVGVSGCGWEAVPPVSDRFSGEGEGQRVRVRVSRVRLRLRPG
eukprot:2364426-Prymnesium_polylepis.1